MVEKVSIRPSEMVEGGVVPVDKNLLVKESRFVLFDYMNKAGEKVATTTAARLALVDDDGVESVQHYSAADPSRFLPGQDGRELVPVGAATNLNKSSNFFILMNGLINAGFPENKVDNDISVLEGLYAYWIGVPEPKRVGLARTAEQDARVRVIPVPSQIHRLPWEKAKPGAKASVKTGARIAAAVDITDKAIKFIGEAIGESGAITRQELAVRVFRDLAKDADRDAIATAIFSPAIQAALLANGFTIDGESISKG